MKPNIVIRQFALTIVLVISLRGRAFRNKRHSECKALSCVTTPAILFPKLESNCGAHPPTRLTVTT
jgi:hypothetical protein